MHPEELERSATQQQLHELHAAERNATSELQEHLARLSDAPCFSGKPLDVLLSLMFSMLVATSLRGFHTDLAPQDTVPRILGELSACRCERPRPSFQP